MLISDRSAHQDPKGRVELKRINKDLFIFLIVIDLDLSMTVYIEYHLVAAHPLVSLCGLTMVSAVSSVRCADAVLPSLLWGIEIAGSNLDPVPCDVEYLRIYSHVFPHSPTCYISS